MLENERSLGISTRVLNIKRSNDTFKGSDSYPEKCWKVFWTYWQGSVSVPRECDKINSRIVEWVRNQTGLLPAQNLAKPF